MIDYKSQYKILLPLCLLFLVSSCATEETVTPILGSSQRALVVAAEITGENQSRANGYLASGDVTSGIYYLTFPVNPSGQNVGMVNFNMEGANGTGIVSTENYGELKWGDIRTTTGTNPTSSFTLDNVEPLNLDESGSLSGNLIVDGPDFENRYKAGVFDSEDGTNDLLSGTLKDIKKDTQLLSFTLKHQMARLQMILKVVNNHSEDDGQHYVDLQDAKVYITNMKCFLESYNRGDGTVLVNNDLGDLIIRDSSQDWVSIVESTNTPEEGEGSTDNPEAGEENTDTSEEGEENPDTPEAGEDVVTKYITTYTSQDLVLPYQNFEGVTNVPVFIIKTKVGGSDETFWGYLPSSMIINTDKGESYATDFAFLSGYIMTITATIEADKYFLDFAPVVVESWTNVFTGRFNANEPDDPDPDPEVTPGTGENQPDDEDNPDEEGNDNNNKEENETL